MRRLMWFSLGFAAACALGAYVLPRQGLLLLAALAFLPAAACAVLGRAGAVPRRAAAVLLGCCLGALWMRGYYALYLDAAGALDGQILPWTIRATDYSQETDYGLRVEGRMILEGKPFQVLVYLDDGAPVEPGEELEGTFRFRVTTPEADRGGSYHAGRGIFLLAYQTDEVCRIPSAQTDWRTLPARLRQSLRGILEESFPADTRGFALALLLGDTDGLDYATSTHLSVSGIRHVVSVSGLHVSILFTVLGVLTLRRRGWMALLGLPALALFAGAAGFSPSVNRACLMSALMLLSSLLDREYDGPTALAFAVTVMLAVNPLTITNVGFQLSVVSVAGIFLFQPGLNRWLYGRLNGRLGPRAAGWLAGSVSVTLSAQVLTTPLCAAYFGTVSLVGPLTNLLTLWPISAVFCGILGVCALYPVWAAGAAALGGLLSVPIRLVLGLSELLAGLPLSAVYTDSFYVAAWLVFVYVLLALFALSRDRRPGLLLSCAVLGLCAALSASWAEPMLDEARLTVLDVGQGQCLLLQSGGHAFLVDCGGDSDTQAADLAARTLLSQGVSRLDGLVLTHLDRDHAGAAANLLSRVDTDLLILPPEPTALAERTDGQVLWAAEDLTVDFDGGAITVYAPTYPGSGNEKSLAILFQTENCAILITGDRDGFGERVLLRNADLPQVDVLIAGHHGSKNSTCQELLAAVSPDIVCVSAGADNPYGHPAPELLERLAACGCAVYRTDRDGTITIRR